MQPFLRNFFFFFPPPGLRSARSLFVFFCNVLPNLLIFRSFPMKLLWFQTSLLFSFFVHFLSPPESTHQLDRFSLILPTLRLSLLPDLLTIFDAYNPVRIVPASFLYLTCTGFFPVSCFPRTASSHYVFSQGSAFNSYSD